MRHRLRVGQLVLDSAFNGECWDVTALMVLTVAAVHGEPVGSGWVPVGHRLRMGYFPLRVTRISCPSPSALTLQPALAPPTTLTLLLQDPTWFLRAKMNVRVPRLGYNTLMMDADSIMFQVGAGIRLGGVREGDEGSDGGRGTRG